MKVWKTWYEDVDDWIIFKWQNDRILHNDIVQHEETMFQ